MGKQERERERERGERRGQWKDRLTTRGKVWTAQRNIVSEQVLEMDRWRGERARAEVEGEVGNDLNL